MSNPKPTISRGLQLWVIVALAGFGVGLIAYALDGWSGVVITCGCLFLGILAGGEIVAEAGRREGIVK